MQANLSIRQNMGLTQKKMALLLGISREQWNHYEASRRGLPKKASLKYALLVNEFVLSGRTVNDQIQKHSFQKELMLHAEKKLKECNHLLYVVSNKMKNGLKHQDAVAQTELVASCVDGKNERDRAIAVNLMRLAALKGMKEAELFFDWELKREILEFEKQVLERKIEEIGKRIEV